MNLFIVYSDLILEFTPYSDKINHDWECNSVAPALTYSQYLSLPWFFLNRKTHPISVNIAHSELRGSSYQSADLSAPSIDYSLNKLNGDAKPQLL